MHAFPVLPVAAAFPWLNLAWVLLGITAFLCGLAGLGRLIAASHPDPVPRVEPEPGADAAVALPPDVAVIISAAVYAAFGESARITAVVPKEHVKLSVDSLMLQWSLEGRREIYSSHRVR